jgi:hypothetical protein
MKDGKVDWTSGTYGGDKNVYRGLVGKSEGKDHVEDQGVDGRILVEGRHGLGLSV